MHCPSKGTKPTFLTCSLPLPSRSVGGFLPYLDPGNEIVNPICRVESQSIDCIVMDGKAFCHFLRDVSISARCTTTHGCAEVLHDGWDGQVVWKLNEETV